MLEGQYIVRKLTVRPSSVENNMLCGVRGHDIFADWDLNVDILLYFLSKYIIKVVFADMIFSRFC